MGRSIAYFPVVGAVIGLLLVLFNWLFGLFLPGEIANGLLLVSLVAITGALHLDGFIDTCDGIAGHRTVEERWRIMHDSRAGAFGIVGVVLLLLVKYASLNSLPDGLLLATLVLMPVISRWATAYAVFAYPSARPTGLGSLFKQGASWPGFAAATVVTLALVIGLARLANITYFYLAGPALMLAVWVITVAVAAYLKWKFSGLSGDNYGAINELSEISVLILVGLMAHNSLI